LHKNQSQTQLDKAKGLLLDPLAKELADKVEWWHLNEVSSDKAELFPVAVTGNGSPLLLIHGFDSCFLEYRRLVPYLKKHHQLIIPDLYGFGFCPRPKNRDYGIESIITHLLKVIEKEPYRTKLGVIGASMGGAIAMELARRSSSCINRLLLLSPAGLSGKPKPVPKPFDQIGVWFLKNKFVREQLCIKAFANPEQNVGIEEMQIASIHLDVPGWGRSLAAFARSGGVANCGTPPLKQPIEILWGKKDKILSQKEKDSCKSLVKCRNEEICESGHLPHLETPEIVASRWLNK